MDDKTRKSWQSFVDLNAKNPTLCQYWSRRLVMLALIKDLIDGLPPADRDLMCQVLGCLP